MRLLALLCLAGTLQAQTVQTWDGTDRTFLSMAPTPAVDSARAALERARDNPAAYIELARAQAGVRQMREAVATLTEGLERFPDNAMLLRWRGHRYLNLRELDRASIDLERGIAIDPRIYGLWYHLGVVRFLRADYNEAAEAFAKARPLAPDSAEAAGSADWLWSSLRMAGRHGEALTVVRTLPAFRGVNNAYTRRLALYAGRQRASAMITPADTADTQRATLLFGTAVYLHLTSQPDSVPALWRDATATTGWPAFAHSGAEQMLARYGRGYPARPREPLEMMFRPPLNPPTDSENACFSQIPAAELRRANVGIRVSPLGDAPPARTQQLLDQYSARLRTAVEHQRQRLTGRADSLPDGAPRLTWFDAEHSEAFLLLSRDGRTQIEPAGSLGPTDSAFAYLSELVEQVRRLQLPPLTWGAELPTDTVVFTLRLNAPIATSSGFEDLHPARVNIPTMTLLVPIRTPWRVDTRTRPVGTSLPRPPGLPQTLTFEFFADSMGVADSASVHIVNIPSVRRAEDGQAIRQYEGGMARIVRRIRYIPGRIGGCATRGWLSLNQTQRGR